MKPLAFDQTLEPGHVYRRLTTDIKTASSISYQDINTLEKVVVPNVHLSRAMEENIISSQWIAHTAWNYADYDAADRYRIEQARKAGMLFLAEHGKEEERVIAEHYLGGLGNGLFHDKKTDTYRSFNRSDDMPHLYHGCFVFSDHLVDLQEELDALGLKIHFQRGDIELTVNYSIYDLIRQSGSIPAKTFFEFNDGELPKTYHQSYVAELNKQERSQFGRKFYASAITPSISTELMRRH